MTIWKKIPNNVNRTTTISNLNFNIYKDLGLFWGIYKKGKIAIHEDASRITIFLRKMKTNIYWDPTTTFEILSTFVFHSISLRQTHKLTPYCNWGSRPLESIEHQPASTHLGHTWQKQYSNPGLFSNELTPSNGEKWSLCMGWWKTNLYKWSGMEW